MGIVFRFAASPAALFPRPGAPGHVVAGRGGPAGGLVCRILVCLLLATVPAAGEKLMVLAVDGGGHAPIAAYLREGKLPAFARISAEGAFSDGLVTAFPSKTASSFAMIWTGQPPRVNGVTGNEVLRTPAAAHTLLETADGFSAEVLRVDPLWTRVARRGRRAIALHTTHTWPLSAALRGLPAEVRDRLHLLTGYASERLAPETLTGNGTGAGGFRFRVGDSGFRGQFFDDPAHPASGWDTLGIRAGGEGPWLARVRVGPEGGFSSRIGALRGAARVEFRVRAFEADAGTGAWVVFRTGASAVGMHPDRVFRRRLGEPAWSRTLGAAEFAAGGPEGTAGRRVREITARIAEDALEHLEAATTIPDWDFLALYLPFADEAGHLFQGFLDERSGADPVMAARVAPILEAAFTEVDRVLGRMLEIADKHRAHLLVVADHGISGINRRVHLNEALRRAGLLAFGEDGRPDLSRTRALLLTTADGSIALNREVRPSGIVSPEEEAEVWREVERVLLAIRHEGAPVVTGFLDPAEAPGDGFVHAGGDSTGGRFPLLRPGFLPSALPAEDIVMPVRPAGNHGFLPTRRDMQAVFAAWGPRIPAGIRWPRTTALDVVPTALDLMGLPVDPALPGRSLLGEPPLIEPAGRPEGTEGGPRRTGR